MLVASLFSLALASVSAFLCLNVQEDALRASLACVAVLSAVFTLCFAPWALKLTLAAFPLAIERLYRLS